jgi:predicted phage terminase large subunit-like protein
MAAKRKDNDPALELELQVKAAQRLIECKTAQDDFLRFVELSMPHPEDPDDPFRTRYKAQKVHRYLADKLQQVERGELLRLIITVQPRVGKSELVSAKFPAWFVGRDGYRFVAVASYADTLAEDFGRSVRDTMKSPVYRQVFPEVDLKKGSQSVDRLQTTQGGVLSFVGVGTGLTGKGANCLPAGTMIRTDKGEMPIEKIFSSPYCKVLTRNDRTGHLEYKRIQAVSRSEKAGIRRITTASGRVVEATPDHRVWTPGGYVPADQLASGDSVLRLLRENERPAGVRVSEADRQRADGVLLRSGVLVSGSESKTAWGAGLLSLRQACAKIVRFGDRRIAILRAAMQRKSGGGSQAGHEGAEHGAVPCVRDAVRKKEQQVSLLFSRLRGYFPFGRHVGRGEPSVEERRNPASADTRREGFSGAEAVGADCGQETLRGVQEVRHEAGGPPHKLRPRGQSRVQPGDSVLEVPPGVASCGSEQATDTVALVERVRTGPELVYDIQVADNHNFFANGVLVHNCLIVDDPIKDDVEAQSKTTRDKVWAWFNRVALTRLMGRGAVVICMTRWHEDDLVGRLTDPKNPHYDPKEAAKWEVVNIPAFAEPGDPLGRKPKEILWPERTSKEFLESVKRMDPAGFQALFMGRPSPPEGAFFKAEHLRTYQPEDLPGNLRIYAASDHAVSQQQGRDRSCMGCVGVDEHDNIYVLPDLVWRQLSAEDQVESMLEQMRTNKPLYWWAEKGHISQSIGPFLRRRMQEEGVYINLVEVTPVRDKMTRAQSIQARTAMGKVFFPAFASWWPDARDELLSFPNGTHDDFCLDADTKILMGDGSTLRIADVRPGQLVATPAGARQVLAAEMTDDSAEVYCARFDDGTELIGTGNHPVATPEGFVRLDSLPLSGMVIDTVHLSRTGQWRGKAQARQRWLSTKGGDTGDTRIARTDIIGATSTGPARVVDSSIATYGRTIGAPSLQVSTSTTETETQPTTESRIWSALSRASTGESISSKDPGRPSTLPAWKRFGLWLRSGINPKKGARGTRKWWPKLGTSESGIRLYASNAGESLRPRFHPALGSAQPNVATLSGTGRDTSASFRRVPHGTALFAEKSSPTRSGPKNTAVPNARKKVVSVEKLADRRPVYNLTVEDQHVYFANGVLTHNCDWLAWVGRGLSLMVGAEVKAPVKTAPQTGSIQWILQSADRIRNRKPALDHTRYLQ